MIPLVLFILAAGCATVSPPQIKPSSGATPSTAVAEINRLIASAAANDPTSSPDYQLGPEDVLLITLFNIQGADGGVTPRELQVRISQKGLIKLPLLGELPVAGLTASGLENLVRDRYDKYFHDPEVGVFVREYRSQKVSVIGAVNKAGVLDLTGPKTLIDILALAGGVSQRAGNQVHVYRKGPDGRESYVIDLFALASNVGLINDRTAGVVNLPVQGGDIINVPEAGMFFVDGAVRRPGSFPLGRRFTATQAIALAGGVNPDLANYAGITLYRPHANEVQEIPVNLNAIRNGTDADPTLEADDILFVPISEVKWVLDFMLRRIPLPSLIPSPLGP